ncbi:MAG: DUF1540 domain-containing protein [Thermincolia bacterium]
MNQHIHCSVSNCHYWVQGNKCEANEIVVVSDSLANQYPDNIDAPKAATIPATPANTCMATCCKTFVQQGSNKTNVDGVNKMS